MRRTMHIDPLPDAIRAFYDAPFPQETAPEPSLSLGSLLTFFSTDSRDRRQYLLNLWRTLNYYKDRCATLERRLQQLRDNTLPSEHAE